MLRNKADLQNQDDLDEFELAMFLTRADEVWPEGNLDSQHYLALHHHLFQDVYEWAGTFRKIRIGKGGNWFCYPEYIQSELDRVFADLESANHFKDMPRADFSKQAAHFLAELNAIHPFREGNGRAQLSMLSLLIDNADLPFHDDELARGRVMDAMIASFSGNEETLAELISDLIR